MSQSVFSLQANRLYAVIKAASCLTLTKWQQTLLLFKLSTRYEEAGASNTIGVCYRFWDINGNPAIRISTMNLSVHDLPAGTYLLSLIGEGLLINHPIIIQH